MVEYVSYYHPDGLGIPKIGERGGCLSIFSCAAFRKNLFFVYLTMLRNLNLFRITLSQMFSYFLPAVM